MRHKWLMILLGILMDSHAAAGQIPAPQIVLAQKPVAPVITVFKAESMPLSTPSLLLSQDRENSLAHRSLRSPGPDYRDHGLERLSPAIKFKTLMLTQVNLPLVQLWDGKLELDAFQSTMRIENVNFGALGYGAAPESRFPQQNSPAGPRSVHLSGLSLNFHFGRVGRTRRPTQAWRCVPRIVAALLQ